jgi:hypothetical protein
MSLDGCFKYGEQFRKIVSTGKSGFRQSELVLMLMASDRVLKDENIGPENW